MKEEDVRVWALTKKNTENREAARVVRSAALPYGAVGGDIAWGVCDRMVTGNKKKQQQYGKNRHERFNFPCCNACSRYVSDSTRRT